MQDQEHAHVQREDRLSSLLASARPDVPALVGEETRPGLDDSERGQLGRLECQLVLLPGDSSGSTHGVCQVAWIGTLQSR